MKFRISWQDYKADPLRLIWVVLYAFVFGLALFPLVAFAVRLFYPDLFLYITFAPFVEVGGSIIEQGLERFSGKEIVPVWTAFHTHIVSEIVTCYVIAPALFLWGLRERAVWRQVSGERRFPTKIVLALGLSASIVMGVAFLSTIPPFIAYSVRLSMQNAQKAQANKDVLINDINYVALKAQSFYFVDVKDGGGGGRWANIQRNGSPELGIDEIAPAKPVTGDVVGKLFPQQPSRFVLAVRTADSLTVKGVATEEGDFADFENADGRRGRIQVSIAVTPKRIKVTFDN